MEIKEILEKEELSKEDIIALLSITEPSDINLLRKKAFSTLKKYCGEKVYYRGLIEFSNVCDNDCYYCGIRKSNKNCERYMLSQEQILDSAIWCANQGYGSVVLQSGERIGASFVNFVETAIKNIKEKTVSDVLPNGVGITLCVGEHEFETYKKFFDAGAHRYLLRIETTNPELYKKLHPESMSLEHRTKCLESLQKAGFQVGTGVMIGLPDQTIEDLANDILFFKKYDIDMIGMGPYITHKDTPMVIYQEENKKTQKERFLLALKMIAVTRLVLKDVNIAATTALQAIDPVGREKGLQFGANVVMPQLTPTEVRKEYQLYDNKPCTDERASDCENCLSTRLEHIGRTVAYNEWGDPKHFARRNEESN